MKIFLHVSRKKEKEKKSEYQILIIITVIIVFNKPLGIPLTLPRQLVGESGLEAKGCPLPQIRRLRAPGHNLRQPLGSRQVLPASHRAPDPESPTVPCLLGRWSMPSGRAGVTEGFARAHSASPGFSRGPRGAGGLRVGGVTAAPGSLGRASGELLRRAGLSPPLRLLRRCWSAAPGCSTWRAEHRAGSPRGRAAGGADCGRMRARLLQRCETSLQLGQVPGARRSPLH